jgi:hypothetical protein
MEIHSYGCLYFKDDAFSGCEKVQVTGEVPSPLIEVAENRLVIGPVVDQDFWRRQRVTMAIDRGPCELSRFKLRDTAV